MIYLSQRFLGGKAHMYAIIETGGKQYRVEKGDVIDIDLLDAKKEGKIEFKNPDMMVIHF